jgi:Phage integrase family
MKRLGIARPNGGVHVGIHCFRHGVTTELLEAGTPIHLVTRMMRHGDAKVTLNHYAHVVADAERAASEKLSRRIGAQLESDPNWSQFLQLRAHDTRAWRRRVEVESTIPPAKGRIAGFEGREGHRTPFASIGSIGVTRGMLQIPELHAGCF